MITNTGIKQKNKNSYIVVFQPTGIQIWFGSLLKINKNEINKQQQYNVRNKNNLKSDKLNLTFMQFFCYLKKIWDGMNKLTFHA